MTKTVTWNAVSSTTVDGLVIGTVTRQLLGQHRGSFVDVPGRAGSWYFSEERGRRKIKVEMFLIADTIAGRGATVEALADWLDVGEVANLQISDHPDRFYRGVLISSPEIDEWRELAGPFEMEWSVDPYAYDNTVSTRTWTSDGTATETWAAGLLINSFPVITIQPTNGTLTNIDLEVNGSTLSYVGTIPDDTIVVVNSISPIITTGVMTDTELTGAYNTANVFVAGFTGDFPELIPGSNSVRLIKNSGTATAIDINVYYRKQYRR